ncbi:MAG: hypothetical protein JWO69_1646, partial [Thermoleophilia bacterium]|nr:hypothetical protein [Thermoleophilia bacterium]
MTSVSATTGAAVPAGASNPINPQLAAVIAQLPADQKQAALAQVAKLTPAQQQQLLAQASQQQAQAQSQTLPAQAAPAAAGAQATAGASAIKQPNRMTTILKNVAIFGGIGAALGFGASFLTLPIIGKVAAPIAAAVGGALGVAVGVWRGIASANAQDAEYQAAVAAEQAAA